MSYARGSPQPSPEQSARSTKAPPPQPRHQPRPTRQHSPLVPQTEKVGQAQRCTRSHLPGNQHSGEIGPEAAAAPGQDRPGTGAAPQEAARTAMRTEARGNQPATGEEMKDGGRTSAGARQTRTENLHGPRHSAGPYPRDTGKIPVQTIRGTAIQVTRNTGGEPSHAAALHHR